MRRVRAAGGSTPKAFIDAPVITDEIEYYLTIYRQLATCVYFPGGLIPYNEIVKYCIMCGYDAEATQAVVHVIMTADLHVESHKLAEQQKRAGKGKKVK